MKNVDVNGYNIMNLRSPHFPGGSEKNHEKSLTIAGDPGDILCQHLSNASLRVTAIPTRSTPQC